MNYDDAPTNFTASAWNTEGMVDLFADAGTKSLGTVFMTKYYDDFTLFYVF